MYFIQTIILTVFLEVTKGEVCGCKSIRPCYKRMLDKLLLDDEDACVENVSVGVNTVTIFLKAIKSYCSNTVKVYENLTTTENRNLYEVVINGTKPNVKEDETLPVIVLDAGQDAGTETVAFALYVIEQLLACAENRDMIRNVRWVILPSSNPDGTEYSRNEMETWRKNCNNINTKSYGVDVTRNFDESWNNCPANKNIFSQKYPGRVPNSENETIFIMEVLNKYKSDIKTYVSLRRDGHGIFYPYASKNITFSSIEKVKKRAGDVAAKVNQRAGGLQWFVNDSIFNMNREAHCGHSVDYAINKLNIPFSFEMRIFSKTDDEILSNFQSLPKGHEVTLRAGYFSGIREIYNSIMNERKQKKQAK
ncbi:zinc carboxypeptidase A 1-like [Vanessa cardui]|uniref:zinc carboxypeptidase A 1-like n=1 Tax=Vanessa cardui TaxID=171605 RepID=UPI001F140F65|nr:zinc carboxypeptidase A 1-like [Vanessa cardui]